MAEKIETAKATSEIDELVHRTITLISGIKAASKSTRQISQQAKAQIAEVQRRRYDEDAEIAENIYKLRELSKAKGSMSFKSICDKLDKQITECKRLAEDHTRFIALPDIYQQALKNVRKKASKIIVAKIEAITSKAASQGKDPDLEYVSRELKAMCSRAGKQNNPFQNSAVNAFLKAIDAQGTISKKRELVRTAMETLASKVGLHCVFGDDGAVSINSAVIADAA
jgi:hypothetical protein